MAPEHLVLLVNGEGITLQAWADGITPTRRCRPRPRRDAQGGNTPGVGPLLWSFCDNSRSLPEQLEALAAWLLPSCAAAAGSGRRWPGWGPCPSLVVAVVLLLGTGWWHGADENESTRSEQALKRFLAAPNYRQVVLNSSDPELWQPRVTSR